MLQIKDKTQINLIYIQIYQYKMLTSNTLLAPTISLLLLLILTVHAHQQKQKKGFFRCSEEEQSYWLYQFFYDIDNEFYVDIGGYDPYYQSNTLYLYSKGWRGLTIQASPDRLSIFHVQRPTDLSINLALGYQSRFVTFHDSPIGQVATLSDEVARIQKNAWNYTDNLNVPSLSLSELCHRYFPKKPIFMSLDTEGFGRKILESNDWNQNKCYPDILFSEQNFLSQMSKLGPVQEYIKKFGYKLLDFRSGLNEIYVHQSVYEKYTQKLKKLNFNISQYHQVTILRLAQVLKQQLNLNHSVRPHYYRYTDPANIHIVKNHQPIQPEKLTHLDNMLLQKAAPKTPKNRPILLYNFDPKLHSILLSHNKYTITRVQALEVRFYNLTYFNERVGAWLTVLTLDLGGDANYPINVVVYGQKTGKQEGIQSQEGQVINDELFGAGSVEYYHVADVLSQSIENYQDQWDKYMGELIKLGVLLGIFVLFVLVILLFIRKISTRTQQVQNQLQAIPKSQYY